MAKHIGRLVNVGYGIEGSRGVAAAIQHRQPKTTLTVQDKFESIVDGASYGNLLDAAEADNVKEWSEWNIEHRAYVNGLGYLLLNLLWGVTSTDSAGARKHTFNLLTSNTHQSLSIGLKDPNLAKTFALCMIQSVTISMENAGEVTIATTFMGKKWATATHTVSYSTDYSLLGRHAKVYLASALSGLDAANAASIKSVSLTISKNLEMDYALGEVAPDDIYNTFFTVEGTITALYDAETYKDMAFNSTATALRLAIIDPNVTIGTSANPSFILNFAKLKFTDWNPNRANDEIVKQTLNFKGLYSQDDAEAMNIDLINTITNYTA